MQNYQQAGSAQSFKLASQHGLSCRLVFPTSRRVSRPQVRRRAGQSSELDFEQGLQAATGRMRALEAYKEMLAEDSENFDLFRAALLIAKHRHPLLDEAQCAAQLQHHVDAVQSSLPASSSEPGYQLAYITRHLSEVAGFTGNQRAYYDIDNSCLNMVLEQGTGIPITLGLVYMLVAERLGCKLHGLNLPGHFMLGVSKIEGSSKALTPWPVTQVIDPFEGFKLCSLPEVEDMFAQRYKYKLQLSTAAVTSGRLVMTPHNILVRMLHNLKNIYTGMHQADKVLQICRYLRATRERPGDIRDEGLCLYALQRYADSAELLKLYQDMVPNAEDGHQVNNVLDNIYRILQQKPDRR